MSEDFLRLFNWLVLVGQWGAVHSATPSQVAIYRHEMKYRMSMAVQVLSRRLYTYLVLVVCSYMYCMWSLIGVVVLYTCNCRTVYLSILHNNKKSERSGSRQNPDLSYEKK